MLLAPMTDSEDSYIIYHPLAHSQTRNKDTSTVIIGGINRGRASQASAEPADHPSMRGNLSEQSAASTCEHSKHVKDYQGSGNDSALSMDSSSHVRCSDRGKGNQPCLDSEASQSQATYYALATLDGKWLLV